MPKLPHKDKPTGFDPAHLAGLLRRDPGADVGEGDAVWFDVLSAVDRTYADLVNYQERLEWQNRELEDLRSFLGSILASVSDALIVVTRSGEVLETSASVARLTGSPASRLHGRALADLFTPETAAALDHALAEASNRRAPVTLEAALISPEGPAPLELSVSPRLDDRARLLGYVLTGRPVGELRQAYSQLERSHEDLKSAQAHLVRNEKLASLGRLLAGVAHELNNPISFVYANAHALERYAGKFETYFQKVQAGADRETLVKLREELKLDREVRNLRDAVQGAREGAERVRDIVEDLRRLSAEGSGEMVDFDLVEIARTAANWVQRGSKSAVEVTFTGAPGLRVKGRSGHIQQVVMNLVQNAIDAVEEQSDHSGPGRIAIDIARTDGQARITVSDDGPGMPDDVAQAVFDPFFTTKPVGRGTGLGLSISHKIVEEHGGRLRLCPRGGALGGACFSFELALAEGGA